MSIPLPRDYPDLHVSKARADLATIRCKIIVVEEPAVLLTDGPRTRCAWTHGGSVSRVTCIVPVAAAIASTFNTTQSALLIARFH